MLFRSEPQKWRDGKSYRKRDLVVHANAVAQCLAKRCGPAKGQRTGAAQPGTAAAAGVWGDAVPTEEELAVVYQAAGLSANATDAEKKSSLDTFVAALVAVPPGAEVYAEAWAPEYLTLATAYAEGSLALGEDGAIYECQPEALTGKRPGRGERATTPQLADTSTGQTVQRQREVLLPCCESPPGTSAGKAAWKPSSLSASAIQPAGLRAQDYDSSSYYAAQSLAVQGGAVWECAKDQSYCDEAPGTALGAKGWRKTPWKAADLGKARPGKANAAGVVGAA